MHVSLYRVVLVDGVSCLASCGTPPTCNCIAATVMAVRSHGKLATCADFTKWFMTKLTIQSIRAVSDRLQPRVMRIAGGCTQSRTTRRRRPAGGCSKLQATTNRLLVWQSRWFFTAHPCTWRIMQLLRSRPCTTPANHYRMLLHARHIRGYLRASSQKLQRRHVAEACCMLPRCDPDGQTRHTSKCIPAAHGA